MRFLFVFFACGSLAQFTHAQNLSLDNWSAIESTFVADWSRMRLAPWPLGYKDFFNALPDASLIGKRDSILSRYDGLMQKVKREELPLAKQKHYDHFRYLLDFHKSLLALSRKFTSTKDNIDRTESIYELKDTGDWYRLFVRKYTSLPISPDSVFNYGLSDTENLSSRLNKVKASVTDFHTWISDTAQIRRTYGRVAEAVQGKLSKYFALEGLDRHPIEVRPIISSSSTTPPAYYGGTDGNQNPRLYYNYFNQRHDVSDVPWLYLHEGVPGHHLQFVVLANNKDLPFFNDFIQFEYNGLFEGWACYIESYGYPAGIYADPKMEYAYLRWNLIRSMRLCIDVGLNYYGWPKEKAVTFWERFLKDEPELMEREIARCKRWPAQALSYKIGSAAMEVLRKRYLSGTGKRTEKDFHTAVLNQGMVPLEILVKQIK